MISSPYAAHPGTRDAHASATTRSSCLTAWHTPKMISANM
jgi:hypothetical protein